MLGRRRMRKFIGHRVAVNTRSDRTIRGTLEAVEIDCIVLAHPEYLGEAQPTPMEGKVVIERPVEYFQALGSGA